MNRDMNKAMNKGMNSSSGTLKPSKTDILAGAILLWAPVLAGLTQTPMLRSAVESYLWMAIGVVMVLGLHRLVPLALNMVWILFIYQMHIPAELLLRTGFLRHYPWFIAIMAGCLLGAALVLMNEEIRRKIYFLPGLLISAGYLYHALIYVRYAAVFNSGMNYETILRQFGPKIVSGIAVIIYFTRYKTAAEQQSTGFGQQITGAGQQSVGSGEETLGSASAKIFETDHTTGIKRKKGGQDLWDIR